jgi:hypothetical protein
MQITTSHRGEPVPASRETISQIVSELPGQDKPFAVLGGADSETYAQTLATPTGFLLEYQEGSTVHHFVTVRSDLSAEEVVEALSGYLDGNPAWQGPLEFRAVNLDAPSDGIGTWLTKLLGRLLG